MIVQGLGPCLFGGVYSFRGLLKVGRTSYFHALLDYNNQVFKTYPLPTYVKRYSKYSKPNHEMINKTNFMYSFSVSATKRDSKYNRQICSRSRMGILLATLYRASWKGYTTNVSKFWNTLLIFKTRGQI